MAALTLELLGGYRGRLSDGATLAPATRKGWALLCYLALHADQPVSREALSGLLWGDRFEEQARGSLRQTLYEVRSALGAELAESLEANRSTISLKGDDLNVDALRFAALASSTEVDRLAEAAALYRGPLLAGLEIGEEAFAEWLDAERTHYQSLASRTLEALTEQQLQAGDPDEAVATARRLVALEPLSEAGHRQLMGALAAAGRRSEALAHYQELEALLRAELDVEPDEATQALRSDLAGGAAECHGTAGEGGGAPPASSSPLVKERPPSGWRGRWGWSALTAAVATALVVGFLSWRPWAPDFEPASLERMAYPLPAKPSIAVLPFDNYSEDSKFDYLARGLTEDLTAALSRAPGLFVISRHSAATYEGNPTSIRKVAEDLGVQYLLEGSVQGTADKLRITARLIDALDGRHLWASRFDREPIDVFALQDEIVKQVFVELQVKLTQGEAARIAGRGTKSLEAWLLRVESMGEFIKFTREGIVRARELAEAAHKIDPNWSRPVAILASAHWYEAKREWSNSRAESIRLGMALAKRAIEMDPNEPLGYMALGNLHALQGNAERAIEARRKAVEIAPNDFVAVAGLATRLKDLGGEEEAVGLFERGMRLSPKHPWWMPSGYALALHLTGRKREAVAFYEKAIAIEPHLVSYARMAALYADLGRMDEAQAAAEEVMRLDPEFSIERYMRGHSLHDPERDTWFTDLLDSAGLPR